MRLNMVGVARREVFEKRAKGVANGRVAARSRQEAREMEYGLNQSPQGRISSSGDRSCFQRFGDHKGTGRIVENAK